MKKHVCFLLLLSMLLALTIHIPVFAETADQDENIASNTVLHMDLPANATSSYRAWIPLSDSLIMGDITITFYVKIDYTSEQWSQGLKIGVLDYLQYRDLKQDMTALIISRDNSFSYTEYGLNSTELANRSTYGSTDQFLTREWIRVDMLIDYDAENTTSGGAATYYIDYEKIGTGDFYYPVTALKIGGIQGLVIYNAITSSATKSDYYLDDIIVRSGCIDPEKDDVAAQTTEEKLAACNELITYQPFHTLPKNAFIEDTASKNPTGGDNTLSKDYMKLEKAEIRIPEFKTGALLHGWQKGEVKEENGVKRISVRLVGSIDDLTYEAVGFSIIAKYNGNFKTIDKNDSVVYNTLLGNENGKPISYTAKQLRENGYLYALTLENLNCEIEEIELTVTPFFILNGEKVPGQTTTFTINITAN